MRQPSINLTIKDGKNQKLASAQLRRSADFRKLLECAFRYSCFCTLVVRWENSLLEPGERFLKEASVDCREVLSKSEWPGTRLLNGTAIVYHFELTPHFKTLILNSTESLSSWLHPNFPEDPAFYRKDGSLLFGSISHEEDAFLELTDVEREAFSWVSNNALNL